MVRRNAKLGVALVFGIGVSGCDCISIGCVSGLHVRFSTPPTAPYRLELVSEGASPEVRFIYECPNTESCGNGTMFEDFTPSHVAVTVVVDGRQTVHHLQASYRTVHPSGEHCDTECRVGTVTVPFPN